MVICLLDMGKMTNICRLCDEDRQGFVGFLEAWGIYNRLEYFVKMFDKCYFFIFVL